MMEMEREMMKERKKFYEDLFCSYDSRNIMPNDPASIIVAIKYVTHFLQTISGFPCPRLFQIMSYGSGAFLITTSNSCPLCYT